MKPGSNGVDTEAAAMAQNPHRYFYNIPDVVTVFRVTTKLSPAEAVILSLLRGELRDQPILDLGIGAGRTIPYLRELSPNYVGIDLSAKMIESARERFPDTILLECNAADLSMFDRGRFAAVFFLGAGIDDTSGADRMKILREIYRVLKAGGVFVFCAHNLRAREALLWSSVEFSWSSSPRIFIRDNINFLWSWLSSILKILWNKANDKGYTILPEYEDYRGQDSGVQGVLLSTYYIRSHTQMQQLLQAGFCSAEARDRNGCMIDGGDTVADNFIYYLARKT